METLGRALTREARLIEGLQTVVARYVADADSKAASAALDSLAHRLRQRIHTEETLLFPAIEARFGEDFEPTQRMRREHVAILDLLAKIEAAMTAKNLPAVEGDLYEFKAALHTHHEEEARVIFPLLEPTA